MVIDFVAVGNAVVLASVTFPIRVIVALAST
jgi:hypothetical protein